jgi:hypothetical protein
MQRIEDRQDVISGKRRDELYTFGFENVYECIGGAHDDLFLFGRRVFKQQDDRSGENADRRLANVASHPSHLHEEQPETYCQTFQQSS